MKKRTSKSNPVQFPKWTVEEFGRIVGTMRDGAVSITRTSLPVIRKEQQKHGGMIVEVVDSTGKRVAYALVLKTARGRASVESLEAYQVGKQTGDWAGHDSAMARDMGRNGKGSRGKLVKILGYEVREGTKRHAELLAQKRQFDDLQRSETGRGTKSNPSPEVEALYRRAMAADEAFHRELVRQFGERRAGDLRYQSAKHDAETRAAAAHVRQAMDEFTAAVRTSRKNPAGDAASLYESFHGKPATETLLVEETQHDHEHLAVLGRSVDVWIQTPTGLLANICFDAAGDPVTLASAENGRQLYFEGGDQAVDLGSLQMDGDDWVKDRMVLGQFAEPHCKCGGIFEKRGEKYTCEKCGRKVTFDSQEKGDQLYNLCYNTAKDFDQFKPIDYQHDLGEETGVRPHLEYDPRSKHLYIAGGQYFIEQPMFETSPGIEN